MNLICRRARVESGPDPAGVLYSGDGFKAKSQWGNTDIRSSAVSDMEHNGGLICSRPLLHCFQIDCFNLTLPDNRVWGWKHLSQKIVNAPCHHSTQYPGNQCGCLLEIELQPSQRKAKSDSVFISTSADESRWAGMRKQRTGAASS